PSPDTTADPRLSMKSVLLLPTTITELLSHTQNVWPFTEIGWVAIVEMTCDEPGTPELHWPSALCASSNSPIRVKPAFMVHGVWDESMIPADLSGYAGIIFLTLRFTLTPIPGPFRKERSAKGQSVSGK